MLFTKYYLYYFKALEVEARTSFFVRESNMDKIPLSCSKSLSSSFIENIINRSRASVSF